MRRLLITLFLAALWVPHAHAQDAPAPKLSTTEPATSKPATTEPKLPSIDEVTRALDDLYRSKSSQSTMTMTVVNDRGTREITMESWTKGKDLSLVVIRKPAREAGTATLRTKEGLWNYAPRADRMIRIPTGMLSDAWMGSHFSNDDLVRETSYEDDYEAVLSWAQLDGQRVLKVTFTPKPKAPVVYTKIEFYVRANDYVSLRADYFDREKLMRQMVFTDIRDVDGRPVPHKMTLTPTSGKSKGESTTMVYESLAFDIDVADDLFTNRGLRRAAKQR